MEELLKKDMVINTFVVKIAGRCNLNCSYCYMYNMGDQSYLKQPKFMSMKTFKAFVMKLKVYCQEYLLPNVYISFHGGEPLLASPNFYKEAVAFLRSTITDTKVFLLIQTNGTLLTEEWRNVLDELDIQIGISIDGIQEIHDEYRVYHNGKGSFEDVVKGIQINNRDRLRGIIAVININSSATEQFKFYKSLVAACINILLPDANHGNLPLNYDKFKQKSATPYGDWLIEFYQAWQGDTSKQKMRVPYFEHIIQSLLGNLSGDELIGLSDCGVVVIESNGSIEAVDPLRVCGDSFTRTNLNVLFNNISDLWDLPLFRMYYNSHRILCDKCNNCSIKNICGGGYIVHRYSEINGFDNPSLYCNDIKKLVTYIQNDIYSYVNPEIMSEIGVDLLNYEELVNEYKGKFVENKYLSSFKKTEYLLETVDGTNIRN